MLSAELPVVRAASGDNLPLCPLSETGGHLGFWSPRGQREEWPLVPFNEVLSLCCTV